MSTLHPAPLSLFWYWMDERHRIYLKRQAGEPKPWTEDPILRDYKFTNVFRQLDRGTVWLTENFLKPNERCPGCDGWGDVISCDECHVHAGLLVFNIAWYRMFNWWGTGELLGWQTAETWNRFNVAYKLTSALIEGKQVFTGAHIVYSPPGQSKINAIVGVCDAIFHQRENIAREAIHTRSLEKTFDTLTQFPCVGGFMAYEMVTDLRHTRVLNKATDIYTWANPGPGAIRGLKRLGLPHAPRAKAIESIRELQGRLQLALDVPFGNNDPIQALRGIKIEMRDIEHSLCEFDKYCRVKFGEGEPRSKFNGRT